MQRIACLLLAYASLFVLAASAQLPAQTVLAADRCASLASLQLDKATITSATLVPAATAITGFKLSAARVQVLPSFCRVKISDHPSRDSQTLTEVWLPAAGWNGRYRAHGNGGFAGSIAYDLIAASVTQGYASSGTDAGHEGPNADFALGHPERVKDYGWRAVHDMALQARAIIIAFYGKPPMHTYFTSCSDGGREALMEAQRFPADFDGILAGAPAYNWSAMVASMAQMEKELHESAASVISSLQVRAIGAAILRACDALDGVKDGVLNDPRRCNFHPETLACGSTGPADADTCLTPQQVEVVKTMYATKNAASGRLVYPGYLPGAEDAPGSWDAWVLGDKALMIFLDKGYFADYVHEDPDWKIESFDFNSDYKLATEKTGADVNATDPNLEPFVSRGGRLLMYHGWNDPAIPALGTVEYYEQVKARLGSRATDAAIRLYMVPGMLHCSTGPGATEFGQTGAGPRGDAQHDVFTALEQWVEAGKSPGVLTAAKSVGGSIVMTRPLCAYPASLTYVKGEPNDAHSFACKASAP